MKIGLALGAGAARGWTHLGIIEALENLGIQIDVVSGCSIGAYVGAAYASGNLTQLKDWAFDLTEWEVLRLLGIGFTRSGLASGEQVFKRLADDFSVTTFEEMQRPFAIPATDLYSGREIIFQSGPVVDAVRASCSIPALFAPVQFENRWLVDGAVVNPVPVNLCRLMGADFVIAVNLSADFRPEMIDKNITAHENAQRKTDEKLEKQQSIFRNWFSPDPNDNQQTPPGIMSVMSNSLDIMQARVTRSRLAGDPPDILIEPNLRDVGILEFEKAEELYAVGKEAVERLEKQILYQLSYLNG
ncbi:MAG: putative NTE family protein [Glaciecola sp. HTCC2999]|jgi:NTE family protein|nr:MAG: putative NTE family protein [Glaciecola sp. HTCC2999]